MLTALERLGLAENTLVLMYGDQGYCLGERGAHFGKGTLWERSLHVPLLVAGPGVRPGARCEQPVSLLDVYPTVVDFCGVPAPPTSLDGASLRGLLTDGHGCRRASRWRNALDPLVSSFRRREKYSFDWRNAGHSSGIARV